MGNKKMDLCFQNISSKYVYTKGIPQDRRGMWTGSHWKTIKIVFLCTILQSADGKWTRGELLVGGEGKIL